MNGSPDFEANREAAQHAVRDETDGATMIAAVVSAVTAAIKLSSPATREFWEIPVLFEDEHLLALDKPARLLTSPDPDDLARPSLMKLLHAGIADKKPWAAERSLEYLNNANQLDFDASGVLLARQKQAGVHRARQPVQLGKGAD